MFVITEFVITEFDCLTIYVSDNFIFQIGIYGKNVQKKTQFSNLANKVLLKLDLKDYEIQMFIR